MSIVPQKVSYLAGRIRAAREELQSLEQTYQEASDEWAMELSRFKVDESVTARGVPSWNGKVTRVRANSIRELEEIPQPVVEVRYVRKDGTWGLRCGSFYAMPDERGSYIAPSGHTLERVEVSEETKHG